MRKIHELALQALWLGRLLKEVASMLVILGLLIAAQFSVTPALGQGQILNWQTQVRKYTEAQDWDSAMQLLDEQVDRAPQDTDVLAWRARVLTWSGHLTEAEKEYQQILKTSQRDPDTWMGLANVYLREGKIQEARQAIDTAEELDVTRADVHAARARVLRGEGIQSEALAEFRAALSLDPGSTEARDGLNSLRRPAQHEFRFGQNNDLLSYSADFHDESVSVVSQWNSHWTTGATASFYQRSKMGPRKLTGSITRRQSQWGSLTLGGAVARDNTVIPKSEAFFGLGHGWTISETGVARGVEFNYAQHWYWYRSARILTLNGTILAYLRRDWAFSVTGTSSRSAFSGLNAGWKPSGLGRMAFPLKRWGDKRLSGNILFAAGTEDFAVVDQIHSFASQTYGGGLRFQINARQDLTCFSGYQKRTQNKTDMTFGWSYGIHF